MNGNSRRRRISVLLFEELIPGPDLYPMCQCSWSIPYIFARFYFSLPYIIFLNVFTGKEIKMASFCVWRLGMFAQALILVQMSTRRGVEQIWNSGVLFCYKNSRTPLWGRPKSLHTVNSPLKWSQALKGTPAHATVVQPLSLLAQ